MSNNTLFEKESDTVHVYMAIKRKKENPEITCKQERCYRQVGYNEDEAIRVLKAVIADKPGVYRIYKTVNARKTAVAKKLMLHWFIDGLYQDSSMNSVWTKALLQKECRATKLALVDIDITDYAEVLRVTDKIVKWFKDNNIHTTDFSPKPNVIYGLTNSTPEEWCKQVKTPNGYHIVCDPFDKRILDEFDYADVDYDRFVFVDRVTVK